MVLPTTNNVEEEHEIYNEVEVDTCKTIEHDVEFLAMKKDFLQIEKQISVDPISLKQSSTKLTSPAADQHLPLSPPPLLPAKLKFLSFTLPNSTTSSPRFSSTVLKKKWRNESHAHSPRQSPPSLQQEIQLRRSKSCGEGRAFAPSDDFDLTFRKANSIAYGNRHYGSFSKPEARKSGKINNLDPNDEGFKCGALCLFLPGFGKGKPVRVRKEEEEEEEDADTENVISRTVSMEKFECGSWASSAIINGSEEDGDSMNLYFDLPFELIRSGASDAKFPVTAAFVFDMDRKGVLKNGGKGTGRKSHESSRRHVRFSISEDPDQSPSSCITPRLRKAREDFNAFLEAQSA